MSIALASSTVSGSARCTGGVTAPGTLEVDLISMMVLLVKQVHLQNVGAAVKCGVGQWTCGRDHGVQGVLTCCSDQGGACTEQQ